MHIRMYESGLHYFDPRDQEFTFVKTISQNKESFTARQIKGAEFYRALYTTLIYTSAKEYNWVIHSKHIKNYPVTVQDVEVALKLCGKNIEALKGNNTRENPNVVARYQVKIPEELINLYKEVLLTCDIFFVNKIPFLLTLSQNIYFTAVNHLENSTVP